MPSPRHGHDQRRPTPVRMVPGPYRQGQGVVPSGLPHHPRSSSGTVFAPNSGGCAVSRVEVIGNATLYLGDCRDVLPCVGGFDAIVTDPPYGIGADRMNLGGRAASRLPEEGRWDQEPADLSWMNDIDVPKIVWGGNYFPLPPNRCALVWDKGRRFHGRSFAEVEIAWTNLDASARLFQYDQMQEPARVHRTQKPIALMDWCLGFVPNGTVLDSYMGSGTTGVAAAKANRPFIGIERDPGYFDWACRRIEDAQRQGSLFGTAA